VENLPEHSMDIHVAEYAEIRAHSRDPVCDFEKKKNKTKLSLFGSICEDPPLFFFSNGLMFECDCTAWNHFVSAI
jgi:hypothetical protein